MAESFTEDQRQAIVTMFGGRGATRHPVDLRQSFTFGGKRYFLVLLAGPDGRRRARARADGAPESARDFVRLLVIGLGILIPLFALAYVIR